MRILVLIHEYPPIGGGGGRVAQDVVSGLAKRGHGIRVIAPHGYGLPFHDQVDGIQVTRIPSFRRRFFAADIPAMLAYILVGFLAGLWQIWRFRPNVMHVHFAVPAGALAWSLFKLTGVPYVLTSHLGDVPGGVPEKTGRWFRWIYPFTHRIWRDAAAVTAISDHTRNLAAPHYPVDITVIPNGVNFDALELPALEQKETPQIVFAGRFVHQKNPLLFVRILGAVSELDWRCVMIGDGILREEIEQEIKAAGLCERITLPGWIPPEEVLKILGNSDILLLPSRSEGLPVVGLQALAMGLAVVASRVGGVSSIVQEGVNGFLHEPDDFSEFVTSLRILLSDPVLLLQFRRSSREFSANFSFSQIVKEYENVLTKVTNER